VEPLEELPDDAAAWSDVLGFDPLATLAVPKEDYYMARQFQNGRSFALTTTPHKPWFNNLTCEYTVDEVDESDVEEKKEATIDW
jgi:hypothetical protein